MLETPRTRGPQFVARNLRCTIKSSEGGNVERLLYSNINFEVGPGEILFIRGPSGTGKTLLLRSLAVLDPIQSPGIVTFDGKTPENWGVTHWRSLICYVFQQRVAYPGSPSELYFKAQQFKSQKGRARLDLPTIIHSLGLEQSVLLQPWASLSGGQAQRVQLAIALALQPSVLLVDEPTSALDPDSSRRVEKLLKNCGAAVIWVSHDRTQPGRVGGRVLDLVTGQQSIASTPPSSPGLAEVSSLP